VRRSHDCKALVHSTRILFQHHFGPHYQCKKFYQIVCQTLLFQGPILIGSSKGGMNIEEVALTDPAAIIKIPVDINTGVTDAIAIELAEIMGFKVWDFENYPYSL
jgi:succinyl-CoA synthetase beta subunit